MQRVVEAGNKHVSLLYEHTTSCTTALFLLVTLLSVLGVLVRDDAGLNYGIVLAVVLLKICLLHFSLRRDEIVPLSAAVILLNTVSARGAYVSIFKTSYDVYWISALSLLAFVFYKFIGVSKTPPAAFTTRGLVADVTIMSSVMAAVFSAALVTSVVLSSPSSSWNLLLSPGLLVKETANFIFTAGVLEFTMMVLLLSLCVTYHLRRQKPYTLALSLFMIPQLLSKIVLFQLEMKLHCATITETMNTLSCFALIIGFVVDMVAYNDETARSLREAKTAGEGIHRRLSVQLSEQKELVVKAQTDGNALLSERFSFVLGLAEKIETFFTEMNLNTQQLIASKLNERQAKFAGQLVVATENVSVLLRDLTYLAKIESNDVMKHDMPLKLKDAIEEVLDHCAAHMDHGIELVYAIDENVPIHLIGDYDLLVRILRELVGNGVKFTSRGEVGVWVSLVETKDQAVSLSIRVFDTGVGLSQNEVDICNKFVPFPLIGSVESQRHGSGLGLAISYRLARVLGGDLKATCDAERTNFTLTLTLGIDTDSTEPRVNPIYASTFNGLRVLVIDDNSTVRDAIISMLHAFGCNATGSTGGVQGMRDLKLAVEAQNPYNVALVSYQLSGLDGIDTVRMFKEDNLFASLKIILVLSNNDLADKQAVVKSRKAANSYIMKPIKSADLTSALVVAVGLPVEPSFDKPLAPIYNLHSSTESESSLAFIRVLVAESSVATQREITQIVEGLGHSCTVVSDGISLVAYARNGQFDFILLDLYLPILDGFAATELIRGGERDDNPIHTVPIIGMTAFRNDEDQEKCLAIGIDAYVDKSSLNSTLKKYMSNLDTRRKSADDSVVTPVVVASAVRLPLEFGRKLSGSLGVAGDPKLPKRILELESVISRFVPREFQDLIAPNGMENAVLGDAICRNITTLFSDIRNFTSMTEKMHVHQVIDFLNTYVAFAIPAITEKGGFIDKFIGDAIMALFPHSDLKEQAIAAVSAAVGVMKALDFMRESGFEAVETGIGINTGRTMIGIVGTETRMEPTALGDAVNLASRTESLCKKYGARILITSHTLKAMGDSAIEMFTIRLVDTLCVRGKSQPCEIYEIMDGDREEIMKAKKQMLDTYARGVESFYAEDYTGALASFEACLEILPADKPSSLFKRRCLSKNAPIPEDEDEPPVVLPQQKPE